ncbi:MAG: cell division protein FtsL [Alphaproteobacteria bacterium]
MTRWLQLVSALGVFQVKYRAESLADQVASLQRDVDQEKEKLLLLKAEWSYLIQPARIQKLTENFYSRLQLQPLETGQITSIDLLPERPVSMESLIEGETENAPDNALGLEMQQSETIAGSLPHGHGVSQ